MYFPGGGVQVQDMLDMPTIGALDVRNQCSGFIYALSVADQFIKTGMYKNILVIGSENHSGGLEKSTRGRGVTVIFGDGAGAAVLSRCEEKGKGILSSHLQANDLEVSDINMLIPHQANLRIAQFIQKKFSLTDDKVHNNIMKYGNTTAASVIIALTEAWEQGKIKENDLVLLAAFGSGFTWGSVVIRW